MKVHTNPAMPAEVAAAGAYIEVPVENVEVKDRNTLRIKLDIRALDVEWEAALARDLADDGATVRVTLWRGAV